MTHYSILLDEISRGEYDLDLDRIEEMIRSRKKALAYDATARLEIGDTFVVKNCSPKYWEGVRVKFVMHDGAWLVCLVDSWYTVNGKYKKGDRVRFRPEHVSEIVKFADQPEPR